MDDVIYVPGFLPDPEQVRAKGVVAPFLDHTSDKDGQTYKRVWPTEEPAVAAALEQVLGRPASILAQGFRLNYEGEMPNAAIHADTGWGKYALVVGLAHPKEQSGTAFWKHKASGRTHAHVEDVVGLFSMFGDWDDATKWELERFVPLGFNDAVIYEASRLHSRWPFTAYGTTPADGRLTYVAFFD